MDVNGLLEMLKHARGGLTFDQARTFMGALLRGEFSTEEMTATLTALHLRGETSTELAGFSNAMRLAGLTLPLSEDERETLVDTCGTGGDGSGTFNISTAVALVAAGAGVRVAKHGNRAVTSRCGSADVLAALGIPTEQDPAEAAGALRRHGFAFLLAPRMHPALKQVLPVRRALPFRTVFNLLGPMANPAGARRQVIGVYSEAAVSLVADAIAAGEHMRHVLVVHGAGGLDELSLRGESVVAEVRGSAVRHLRVVPEDAGIARSDDALQGSDAEGNAAILQSIFAGKAGPERDIVVLNAAAVLWVADAAADLREGAKLAAEAIDSGAVTKLVATLAG